MNIGDDQTVVHIVEDNQNIADMYFKWLSDYGYEVRVSYTGRETEEKLQKDTDIAILDRELPDATGEEILSEMQQWRDTPLVTMLTATNPGMDLAEIECDNYLRKPVARPKLLETIEMLEKRRELTEPQREYLSVFTRVELIEHQFTESRLEDEDTYDELVSKRDDMERRVVTDDLDEDVYPDI